VSYRPFVGEIGRIVYKRVTLQFINTVHEDIYGKSEVYQIALDIFCSVGKRMERLATHRFDDGNIYRRRGRGIATGIVTF
jgi:hypothetical protein